MTRNDLHVLARQAMRDTNTNGDDTLTPWMVRFVERFGRLVAEEEREACARTVERARLQLDGRHGLTNETDHIATRIVEFLAAAVRARGEA